jgi:hypothetical protein
VQPLPRLLTRDDIEAIRVALDAEVRKDCCSCKRGSANTGVTVSMTGTATGSTVTENATVTPNGPCIEEDSYRYYWWNCSSAQSDYANAGSRSKLDWHEFGWVKGEASHSESHAGIATFWHDRPPYLDMTDAGRWNWSVRVIFIYCGKDGHRHAGAAQSGYEEWEWDTKTKSWGGPHDGGAVK